MSAFSAADSFDISNSYEYYVLLAKSQPQLKQYQATRLSKCWMQVGRLQRTRREAKPSPTPGVNVTRFLPRKQRVGVLPSSSAILKCPGDEGSAAASETELSTVWDSRGVPLLAGSPRLRTGRSSAVRVQ